MESHTFLLHLVIILLSARLMGEVAAYFQIPSVIGELLAGLIIGPSILGVIEISNSIHLLAEVGVILLLFEVGLETDVGKLTAAGTKALTVAIAGVFFPFVLGYLVSSYVFDFSLLISLFIASTLTATSVGITLRVLQDLKKQNTREAQIIIGSAVLDDIIGIILLAMLYEFSVSGRIELFTIGQVILFIGLFFLIAPLAAKAISMVIKKWDEKSEIPGLLPTSIVSLILLFAWIAHQSGAPVLLGGFAAGLALSPQFFFTVTPLLGQSEEFTYKVEKHMKPIVHLFSPIFFVAIGLSLNLRTIDWSSSFFWQLSGLLLTVGIAGKLISGFFLKNESFNSKLIIGTAMIPRGEVGLIFANVGYNAKIFKEDIYAAIIIVITTTTLLAPFFLRSLYKNKSNSSDTHPDAGI